MAAPAPDDPLERLLGEYPGLRPLLAETRRLRLPAGARAFRPGAPCGAFLVVLSGTVRVQMVAPDGREIVLYRVGGGETCVLTTSCLLAAERYPAEGVAETEVAALALPAGRFEAALDASPDFRRFVFAGYARRLSELLALVEGVRFGSLDARLAALLLRHADPAGRVALTHRALAAELGSAREAVTRRLRALRARGLVRTGRGVVEIADRAGLARLASEIPTR